MQRTHEQVVFKLIQMPCCGHLLCWVNPRYPNLCPECGSDIRLTVKEAILHSDDEAILSLIREN
jgi:hypothetical protein